ncbi:MAG: hypothetical protein ACPG4T_08585, partial [Nannocystaceae bacterium]
MKVNRDASYTMFMNAVDALEWLGVRLKNIRDAKLTPGGRAHLQLFEAASKSGRAHPRLRVEVASV